MRGYLIAFEGIDGVGKTSQVKAVQGALEALGYDVVRSREPTHGPFGMKLRRLAIEGRLSAEEELGLFMEDRRLHVEEVIRPALDQGKILLLDRYYLSTVAYQGARGFDPLELMERNQAFAPVPDFFVILDLDPECSLSRVDGQGRQRDAYEELAPLKASREVFLAMARELPCAHVVDASQCEAGVTRSVLGLLMPFFEDRVPAR